MNSGFPLGDPGVNGVCALVRDTLGG